MPETHPPEARRAFLAALLVAMLASVGLPAFAHANFVYWANDNQTSIGRAKINGAGANNNFITGVNGVHGVAIDSKFIYWTTLSGGVSSIGRANLDGSGVNNQFITTNVTAPISIAVTSSGILWTNEVGMGGSTIGLAGLDGSNPNPNFISGPVGNCGLATDANFLYFFADATHIGRVGLNGTGVDRNFVTIPEHFCGLAADPSFLYWSTGTSNSVGRVPVGGGTSNPSFVTAGTTSGGPCGVAVNSQYLFWGNQDTNTIGRSNIDGGSPNPAFVSGPNNPCQLAAAPSNKITVNSIAKKKKKGTASISAKVPGPGQVTMNQTGTPPDANATAASVKQVGPHGHAGLLLQPGRQAARQDGEEAQQADQEAAAQEAKGEGEGRSHRLHSLRAGRRGGYSQHPAGEGHVDQAAQEEEVAAKPGI